MTKIVEAIYEDGVFKPVEQLDLAPQQRVELVVRTGRGTNGESVLPPTAATEADRQAALEELFAEVDRVNLQLRVRMPTRDELYDRF